MALDFKHIRKEWLALVAAAIALMVGVLIDWFCGPNWNAFQRSGSLVVAIGIVAALKDLRPLYREQLQRRENSLEERRQEIDIVMRDDEIERGVRGTTDYALKQTKAAFDKKLSLAIWADLLLLVGGTLVWGFGDLVWLPWKEAT